MELFSDEIYVWSPKMGVGLLHALVGLQNGRQTDWSLKTAVGLNDENKFVAKSV